MPPKPDSDGLDPFDGVSQVALRALSQLLGPNGEAAMPYRPIGIYLTQMFDAVLQTDTQVLEDLVRRMHRAGITIPHIAEVYVPLVAQRLGDAWNLDDINFSAVTIGTARLQSMLRGFNKEWDLPRDARMHLRPAYLVGVPRGVHHTLGACVLAGHLRHRGLSVHLDLELDAASLAAQLKSEPFMGVLISVRGTEKLETLSELVETVHHSSRDTPVIIGGSTLQNHQDIRARTRADLVSSDLQQALSFCDAFPARAYKASRDITSATPMPRASAAE